MPIGPGTRIGPYEIRERIGAGGMGEVYRARHARLEREVAVKVLPEHLAGNAGALARFEREARAVAALSHPNILAIHDFGTEAGVSFAAMELLRGETLRGRISAAPLTWRKAVEVAIAIAEGLAAAHAKGIVHRDLKPENIFITHDGQIKILDFGLARLAETLDPSSLSSALTLEKTTPRTILGTPAYMSPEQTRGEQAGPQTDLFSLGCVLHEMLTGKRAFGRASAAEAAAAILKEDPPPPSASDPEVPPALDALVRRCLEKAAGERFQSARDLSFALRAVLAGSDSVGPPISGAMIERRPRDRARLLAAGAIAGVVVVMAAGFWGWRPRARPLSPGLAESASIAVLPFRSLGPADGDPYFADSLSEAVITELSRIHGLMVINRDSAFQFRGRGAEARTVGAELDVRYLVDGSVQRKGDRLQVQAQLIDVATGDHRWAESYERALADVFAIQEDIARSVAGAIRAKTGLAAHAGPRRPPPDFEVYDLYLRGRAAWSRRTPAETARAIELYQEAIRRDPDFAEAYAGLADAWIIESFARRATPHWVAVPRVKAAAERALSIDPTLAEAHATLGFLLTKEVKWEEADREFRRAIELKPSYATAHHWYALHVLAQRGDLEQAERVMSRAAELDPLAPAVNGAFAHILYLRGNYAQAQLRAERARELAPNLPGPVLILSRIAAGEGRRQDALALARRAAGLLAPPGPLARAMVARELVAAGEAPAARAILADLEGEPDPCVPCIVDVHLALGNLDAAVARVERGGYMPGPNYFLKVDVVYDAYRGDPRFRRILQMLRLE